MGLYRFKSILNVTWAGSKANPPFADIRESLTTLTASLGNLDLDTWDAVYAKQLTLTPTNPDETIDLQDFVDSLNSDIVLRRVLLALFIVSGDDGVEIIKGASHGLSWYWDSGVEVLPGEANYHVVTNPANFVTVDSTHKTIDLSKVGTGESVVTIVILGSTLAP